MCFPPSSLPFFLPPLPSFLFYLLCLIGKGQPQGQCHHILILPRHFISQDIREENNVLDYDCCTNDWWKMSCMVPIPISTRMWWTSICTSVLQLFVVFSSPGWLNNCSRWQENKIAQEYTHVREIGLQSEITLKFKCVNKPKVLGLFMKLNILNSALFLNY